MQLLGFWQDMLLLLVVGHYVLAAYLAYVSLQQSRTAQGAMGWVIFLAAAPFLAIPLFVVLGKSRFPSKVTRRRELRGAARAIWEERRLNKPATRHDHSIDQSRIHAFEMLAGVPLLGGNRCELLINGDRTFEAIFNAIDRAGRYILLAFYIIRDDAIGRALRDRLTAAAARGVTVKILYDGVGSNWLNRDYIRILQAARIEVVEFNANRRLGSWFQFNFRNHRKIMVVDGDMGFVGGLNVGDEYMSRNPRFIPWRDTHLQVTGPVVAEIQLAFAEDWLWATDWPLDLNWDPRDIDGDTDAVVVAPGPADPIESGSLYFCNAIGAARERLWIASPYFVPDTDILTSLKLAALRGVDVRILVPARPDHLTVWLAAFPHFEIVREAGVKIYQYRDGFMHQKVLLVDDDIASVGSINLDNRSCRLNFEITLVAIGKGFADEVAAMLIEDFAEADLLEVPLSRQPRLLRMGAHFARLLAPIL